MRIQVAAAFFIIWSFAVYAESTSQQNYLPVFLQINDAAHLEKQRDYLGALARYKNVGMFLGKLRDKNPDWESVLVKRRIKDCCDKVTDLGPSATHQVLAPLKSTISRGPDFAIHKLEGKRLEDEGDVWGAMNEFQCFLCSIQFVHQSDPEWEKAEVEKKIKYAQEKVDELESLAVKKYTGLLEENRGRVIQ